MATKTEILLNAVKFNKLTRAQYDEAKAAGQINENEFYITGETLDEGDMLKSEYDSVFAGKELTLTDESIELKDSSEDRISSVAINGFTTQTGSGDPSPENIRPIENARTRNKVMTVDGNTDGLFMSSVVPTRVAVPLPDAVSNQTPLCDAYKGNRVSQTDKACNIDSNKNFGITDSRFSSLEEAKRILNEQPVTFAYLSTEDTGKYYTGIAVEQGEDYRCEIVELQAPLHEGDTLETNVQSEYDAYAEFDGSSDENWLLDSGSTAGADGSKRMWIKLTGPQTENTSDKAVPVAASNQLTAQSAETTYIAKAANCFDVVYSGATNMLHVRIAGISTVEALKTHLQSHPLRVFYKSASGGTGKNVRRETHVKKQYVFTGTENILKSSGVSGNAYYINVSDAAMLSSGGIVCNQAPTLSQSDLFNSTDWGVSLSSSFNGIRISAPYDTVDALKAELATLYATDNPFTVEYTLSAPEVYADTPV